MCWFQRNAQLYSREWKLVKENLPKLKFYTVNDKILVLKGEIDLKYNGQILDKYNLEIFFPADYPNNPPLLRETDERIPRIQDRHINKYGDCCLFPRLALKEKWDSNPNILYYINELVIPFLSHQSYFERYGEWKNKGYAHGAKGILEFYRERSNIDNIDILIIMLQKLADNEKIGRNDPCFCQSGKKLKKCHEDVYEKLRNGANKEIFEKDMADLKQYAADQSATTEKSF